MSLPTIIATMLAHQEELAQMFASRHSVDNMPRQKKLVEAIQINRAGFKAFVDEHQISVKRRACAAPLPQEEKRPHCEKCATAIASKRKR